MLGPLLLSLFSKACVLAHLWVLQLSSAHQLLTGTWVLARPQVLQLRSVYEVLTGDMLLAAAFVSYAGPFTSKFRSGLIDDWIKFLKERQMPMTQGINDPLKVRVRAAGGHGQATP